MKDEILIDVYKEDRDGQKTFIAKNIEFVKIWDLINKGYLNAAIDFIGDKFIVELKTTGYDPLQDE